MMDQLFTADRDDFRTTLRILCRHLTSIQDLLALENISDTCRAAVRRHHAQEAELSWPEDGHLLTSCSVIGGPRKIFRLYFKLSADESASEVCSAVKWFLTIAARHADHLRQLTIHFAAFPWRYSGDVDQLNRRAEQILLTGPPEQPVMIMFPHCVQLTVYFAYVQIGGTHYKLLLFHLLRHFPALEYLTLKGKHLPLLSHLPAPEKLKKLIIRIDESANNCHRFRPRTARVNFRRLETLSLTCQELFGGFSWPHDPEEVFWPDGTAISLNPFTRFTGVRFAESLNATHNYLGGVNEPNPARSTRLQKLTLSYLTDWSAALLRSVGVFESCHTLHIQVMDSKSTLNAIKQLARRLPGGHLPAVTHLNIGFSYNERSVSELLKLTPSLRELVVEMEDYRIYEGNAHGQCDVDCSLLSLTRLTVIDWEMVRPGWIESVRRNASPGLEVVLLDQEEDLRLALENC